MKDIKFSHARMTLTLWYELFLLCIVVAFSIALFTTETGNFARIVLQRNFGSHPPRILSEYEVEEFHEQVTALRKAFIIDLGITDTIILLVGGGLAYLLAGKTLDPIRKNYETQKEFLANASHEFRTPLAAIQMASEVVLRSENKTKEDYKKVLQQTLQESIRLGVMADELLMLSRIDAGIAKLHAEQCNFSDIIREGVSEAAPIAQAKNIIVHSNIRPHVMGLADKNRLKQLVLILLDNAIKFTPAKGSVTLSLEKTPKAHLIVEDTGEGISKKDVDHIFDRFYQIDKNRSTNSAGLGLSIAKWIANAHGAEISVQSRLHKGTKFIVAFG